MTDGKENGDSERDDDVVAAEFVLGVLTEAERADAARRVDTDRQFAMRVAAWQERFSGMNDAYGETEPPADAWNRIEDQLFRFDPTQKVPNAGLWTSLVFWRALAISAFAMVAVLSVAFLMRDAPRVVVPGPELVASLSASDSDAAFVALRLSDGTLQVTSFGAPPPEGRDLELWAIAGDSAPVSLGLLAADGAVTAVLPGGIADLDPSQLTLAVSVEPQGGSPTGQPTGPVVAVGKLKKI